MHDQKLSVRSFRGLCVHPPTTHDDGIVSNYAGNKAAVDFHLQTEL